MSAWCRRNDTTRAKAYPADADRDCSGLRQPPDHRMQSSVSCEGKITMTNSATSSPPRVAIVTAGSGGIGRVVCERLAADGMSVLVHYAGNPARAEEVVKAITSAGGAAAAAHADVADESAVSALF